MRGRMTPQEIVTRMYEKDAFSQWLGVRILEVDQGHCRLSMRVRPEMCNGFHIGHGGITYALADSTLAFASNSLGQHAVSIETSISHTRIVQPGDLLTATSQLLKDGRNLAIFQITVTNQKEETVALFKGTVLKQKSWDEK
ncbi:MAG: hotdog fold thioesterase [Saprospiraceae bacterium]|nr:hotdog fold thioesterase [Saprospiraceae bacterium]